MELDSVIRRRRMCRDFLADAVEPALVDRVIDRARRAPSAGNSQGWAFLVLEGSDETEPFWAHDADPGWLAGPGSTGIVKAPVVVLPLASREVYQQRYAEDDKGAAGGPDRWHVPYWLVDTAFATMLLLLAAEEEGLGALLFALHADPAPLLGSLGVPAGWQPLGAVVLGWPAERRPGRSAGRGRRPLGEVLHRGRW